MTIIFSRGVKTTNQIFLKDVPKNVPTCVQSDLELCWFSDVLRRSFLRGFVGMDLACDLPGGCGPDVNRGKNSAQLSFVLSVVFMIIYKLLSSNYIVYIYISLHLYICTSIYLCIYIYICTYFLCIYITCIYIYIYISFMMISIIYPQKKGHGSCT